MFKKPSLGKKMRDWGKKIKGCKGDASVFDKDAAKAILKD